MSESTATTERQVAAGTPEKHRSQESPGTMSFDERIEKRTPMTVQVDLMTVEERLVSERAVTVNISPHGARVVTKRRWRLAEQPWLASLTSYFRLQASVVYCRRLANGDFSVGLKFRASFRGWEDALSR